uniref:Uncharacterized protein n=1 Tax=Lepeophtheirus salmonis TaxID=72036 RepID=A0A0K2T2Y1_LEPSM
MLSYDPTFECLLKSSKLFTTPHSTTF